MTAINDSPVEAITEWTYGCPHEGTHINDPNELWVGIIRHVNGIGEWLLVAAIIPPFVLPDRTDQAEVLAKEACDAFRNRTPDWKHVDGIAAWLHAHGHHMSRQDWPGFDNGLAIAPPKSDENGSRSADR